MDPNYSSEITVIIEEKIIVWEKDFLPLVSSNTIRNREKKSLTYLRRKGNLKQALYPKEYCNLHLIFKKGTDL